MRPAGGDQRLARVAADEGFDGSLLEELASTNHQRRHRGCAELGELLRAGQTSAMRVLLEALLDSHATVRSAAAVELATGPADDVETELLARYERLEQETRPGQRASLVYALGLLHRPAEGPLLDALIAAARHANRDVRFQAVAALRRLGCRAPEFEALLPELLRGNADGEADDLEVASLAAAAAADFDRGDLLPVILERWQRARGFAERHLAMAAAHLGSDEVVKSLARAMRHGADALDVVDALVELGSAEAAKALDRGARSRRVHPIVRSRAAVALLELDHPDGRALVEKNLGHRRADVRGSTLEYLGRARLASWREVLLNTLADPTNDDSEAAAIGLGLMGDDEAVAALERAAADDPRPSVRDEAELALEHLALARQVPGAL